MYRLGKYGPSDKMSDVVCGSYSVLLAMSRFGIALGFGDATVEETCARHGVHCATFLTVVNHMLDGSERPDADAVSLDSFLAYLHSSHDYFLEFRLPA